MSLVVDRQQFSRVHRRGAFRIASTRDYKKRRGLTDTNPYKLCKGISQPSKQFECLEFIFPG